MTRIKKWWFDDPENRVMLLGGGASSYRGLMSLFMAPRTIIGSWALQIFLKNAAEICTRRKALIITDEVMAEKAGEVISMFERFEFEVKLWGKVLPEAPLSNIKEGAELALDYNPDLLVAFGGGSVLDTVKAIWILYEKEEMELTGVYPLEPLGLRKKAITAAIPTTSGTGSESTMAVVLTDDEEDPPVKVSLMHPEVVPDFALIDSRYVLGMPSHLAMATGLDALTHATEGYVSTWSSEYTESLSVRAIRHIFDYLPRSIKSGKDREARYKMHVASNLAGLSFSNAVPHLAHGAGHAFGKLFDVHHGLAVGVFLPYTLQYHSAVTEKGDRLARELGLTEETARGKGTAALVERYRNFFREVGGPLAGKELVAEEEFKDKFDDLARIASEDPASLVSVRPINEAGYRRFMEHVFYGKDIDF